MMLDHEALLAVIRQDAIHPARTDEELVRQIEACDVDDVQPVLDDNERLLDQWAEENVRREAAELKLADITSYLDSGAWSDDQDMYLRLRNLLNGDDA